MNRKALFASVLLLLEASVTVFSQRPEELALFRGRTQNVYPFKYNGTFYLDSRRFQKGSVYYNGKEYRDIYMNLDAYAMDLLAKPEEKSGATMLFREQVAWFSFGGKHFVNLKYYGIENAEDAYYQIAKDGKTPLLVLGKKVFRTSANGLSPQMQERMDGNYDASVVNYFDTEETLWALENGSLVKLSPRKWKKRMAASANPQESPLKKENAAWHPLENAKDDGFVQPQGRLGASIGLPDRYFSEITKEDTVTVEYVNNAMVATFRNKTYIIGEEGRAKGQTAILNGTVFEAESGMPLPGVVIHDDKTGTYARSDKRGRYSISLPLGENTLNFEAESKESLPLKINMLSAGTFEVVMTEKINLLKGAIVSASSMQQHRTTGMGMENVNIKTLAKIPSAFGEGDIIKAVLTLPGVKTVGEASGGFNVRGGSADQNLILFNDNTIYNPSHMFGVFSAFNPDLVDNVELYKSSIPAEYGGRISSVLSVKSKDGDPNRFKGSLGIGLLTSRAHVEVPIVKGKTTLVAGARTTYSDWLLGRLPEDSAYSGGSAGFTDANLSVTHRFNDSNTLQGFAYFATDKFSFSGDTTFNYTNLNASVVFRHRGDDGSAMKVSGGFDYYGNVVGAHSWSSASYDLTTTIRQAFLKAKRTRPFGSHAVSYGADIVGYSLTPGKMAPYGDISTVKASALADEHALEPALYASDNWTISDPFSVEAGVRLGGFLFLDNPKFYGGPEFRLSAKYSPVSNLSFKAGFNTMRQYIHLISNTSSVSPMDTWKLSDANIAPTTGWQGAAGAYWTLLSIGLDLSVEGYYKQSRNGLDYKPGATLIMNPNLADDLVPVLGNAYGVEVMLKRPAGKLTGWMSYSYSRSLLKEMQDRGAQTINKGKWYNAPYDKPHEFKLAGNYAFTHRYSASVNVDYSTGRPVTVPVGKYYYGGAYRLLYSERNTHRIPDYFRVDAAFNIDPGHYLKAIAHTTITIGVYNVTGRKNPYSVFFRTNGLGDIKGYMLSVFATQIPYINLNILF